MFQVKKVRLEIVWDSKKKSGLPEPVKENIVENEKWVTAFDGALWISQIEKSSLSVRLDEEAWEIIYKDPLRMFSGQLILFNNFF